MSQTKPVSRETSKVEDGFPSEMLLASTSKAESCEVMLYGDHKYVLQLLYDSLCLLMPLHIILSSNAKKVPQTLSAGIDPPLHNQGLSFCSWPDI
jgi:hypothetical protein